MPMDGVFIHYLTDELNKEILNFKVNKVYQPSPLDILLQVRGKNKDGLIVTKQLLLSSRLDNPRMHITCAKYQNPENPTSFCMLLRKYIERGEIIKINQHNNDRIIELHFKTFNELDDEMHFALIFEIMGRNSNIILINSQYSIIDAIRKLPPSEENIRTIIPHASYTYPTTTGLNPYLESSLTDVDNLEGTSKIIKERLKELPVDERYNFLNKKPLPYIYKGSKRNDFYCFKIYEDDEVIKEYPRISEMLEDYFEAIIKVNNFDASCIEKNIKTKLKHAINKLDNLEQDLTKAKENLKYNDLGILLQANLYLVKKNTSFITVNNFLNNYEEVTIPLDPLKDPSENLKLIFQKAKKAKTALVEVNKQIEKINNEIDYLEDILFQLSIGNNQDIEEIKIDLEQLGYIKQSKKRKNKKQQINITKFLIDGITVYVGKNNVQNDYITHKSSFANDIWFHAKDMPGSHVVARIPGNDPNFVLSEALIRGCAMLASYYSKGKSSGSVPVDYTKIRNLKKIPGVMGSKVIVTNQKTIYIDPTEDFIKEHKL